MAGIGLGPSDQDPIGRARSALAEQPGWTYGSVLPLATDPNGGYHPALPGMLRDLAQGGLDLLEGPRTGVMTPRATAALMATGMGAGRLFPEAGGKVLGMFAGEKAATADLGALARAKAMETAGHDARAIHADTGWFQGPEGKWKFELDDSKAQLGGPLADVTGGARADVAMSHPSLFAAYPGVGATDTYVARGRARGSYNPPDARFPTPSIDVRGPDEGTARSAMLHELQHAVQEHEGFEGGGNPEGLIDRPMANRADDLLNEADRLADAGRHAEAAPLREQGKALHDKARGFNAYERLGGEAEARAVQARADMTPEQRRASFPLDSYDTRPDQLIMRGVGLGR